VSLLKSFITECYEECEKFFEAQKIMNQDVNFVTARHIQDLVKLVLMYKKRETLRIESELEKYDKGMNQLNQAKRMIDDTTKRITQQREKIKEKQDEIEQRKTDLKNHQADLEAKHKEQQDERTKQQSLKTLWETKRNELEVLMKEIQPYMDRCNEEVRRISQTDVGEMVNYAQKENISTEIKEVCNAVKIVSQIKDWKFLQDWLAKCKKDGVKDARPGQAELRKLEKITKKKEFN